MKSKTKSIWSAILEGFFVLASGISARADFCATCKDFAGPRSFRRTWKLPRRPRSVSGDSVRHCLHECSRCYLSLRHFPRHRGSVSKQLTTFVCAYIHSPSLCLKTNVARCTARHASCQIRRRDFRVRITHLFKVFLLFQGFFGVFQTRRKIVN